VNNRQVEVKVEVEKASKATQISAPIQPPAGDPRGAMRVGLMRRLLSHRAKKHSLCGLCGL